MISNLEISSIWLEKPRKQYDENLGRMKGIDHDAKENYVQTQHCVTSILFCFILIIAS